MKMTKKTLAIVLAAVIVVGGFIPIWYYLLPPRHLQLRIYNWENFMDRTLIREFEREYRNQIGNNRFRVRYSTFTSNERMYTQLVYNRGDFDLMVPSEYMVSRLIEGNHLHAIDLSRIPSLATRTGEGESATYALSTQVFDPNILNHLASINAENTYAIPYIYGTLGILFDNRIEGLRDLINKYGWSSLWLTADSDHTIRPMTTGANPRLVFPSFKNIGMEAFVVVQMAMNRAELLRLIEEYGVNSTQYRTKLDNLFGANAEPTPAQIATIQEYLLGLSNYTFFEDEMSYLRFINGTNQHHFGMEWSVSATYAMMMQPHLEYIVPEEGTNIWVNNLVIPSNARNKDAAYAFLEFINRPENSIRNVMATGGTSPILEATEEIFVEFMNYGRYYFESTPHMNVNDEWMSNFIISWFPSGFAKNAFDERDDADYLEWLVDFQGVDGILDRAAVMHHFPNALTQLNTMMTNVQNIIATR